jgi:hypothetical protein
MTRLTLIITALLLVGCANEQGSAADQDASFATDDAGSDASASEPDAGEPVQPVEQAGAPAPDAGSTDEAAGAAGGAGAAGSAPPVAGGAGGQAGQAGAAGAAGSPAAGAGGSGGSAAAGTGGGAAGAAGAAAPAERFCLINAGQRLAGQRLGCDTYTKTGFPTLTLRWEVDAHTTAGCSSIAAHPCTAGAVCRAVDSRDGQPTQYGVCQ